MMRKLKMIRYVLTALAFALGSAMLPAHAEGPIIVEESDIVADKHCRLETWVQKYRTSTAYWVVPACNIGGHLELSLGGARITGPGQRRSEAELQGQVEFREMETNDWGVGLIVGNEFTPGEGFSGDYYATVPVSMSFQDDRLIVHTNLGWMREKEDRRHALTWGIALETGIGKRTAVVAEVYGRNYGKASFQLGVRHWLVDERIQFVASYGNRLGRDSEERFFSIGLALFSGAFLP
jgi:hypothetical protein